MAKLAGLIAHFVYWLVLGKFNPLPIDSYHKTLIFLSVQKTIDEIVAKYNTKKAFTTFFMPMVILAIRRVIDVIFHTKYPLLFTSPTASTLALNNISLLLTKLLDPNVLYSRFSSLESGSSAIAFKLRQHNLTKSRRVQDMFYTNSALISSLLGKRSEGTVRIRFAGPYTWVKRANMSAEVAGDVERSRKCWATVVEDRALEAANSLQMCNVAFAQVNRSMKKRNLNPVLNVIKFI